MTDSLLGAPPRDNSYANLNVIQTLGECTTKIKAKCVQVQDVVIANQFRVRPIGTSFLPNAVYVSLSVTIPNGFNTLQLVIWDNVVSDPASMFDGAGTFTIPSDGIYAIACTLCGFIPAGGVISDTTIVVSAFINGSVGVGSTNVAKGAQGLPVDFFPGMEQVFQSVNLYWEIPLNAGETVQFTSVGQGGTMDILGDMTFSGVSHASIRQLV